MTSPDSMSAPANWEDPLDDFTHQLIEAHECGALDGNTLITVAHDPACAFFAGGICRCDPLVTIDWLPPECGVRDVVHTTRTPDMS
jgi:hypothetical protein